MRVFNRRCVLCFAVVGSTLLLCMFILLANPRRTWMSNNVTPAPHDHIPVTRNLPLQASRVCLSVSVNIPCWRADQVDGLSTFALYSSYSAAAAAALRCLPPSHSSLLLCTFHLLLLRLSCAVCPPFHVDAFVLCYSRCLHPVTIPWSLCLPFSLPKCPSDGGIFVASQGELKCVSPPVGCLSVWCVCAGVGLGFDNV